MAALHKIAADIRKNILAMHARANSSHIGSSFSCVDLLVVLYFAFLTIDAKNPQSKTRDRFILSKGHAASALYATLAARGLMSQNTLDTFAMDGGHLPGHVDRMANEFIEASTGSLGHGLPIAVGIAQALKMDHNSARVVVLISDGEMQEGSIWEAANMAQRLKLDKPRNALM